MKNIYIYIEEGLFDKLPKEIQELEDKFRENNKIIREEFKKERKNSNFLGKVTMTMTKPLTVVERTNKKTNINPKSIIEISDSNGSLRYHVFFIYKDYILIAMYSRDTFVGLRDLYNKDRCEIPKNIAFELFNSVSDVSDVKAKSKSITVSNLYSIDKSKFTRLQNKYGDTYNIKRNIITNSITISIKK